MSMVPAGGGMHGLVTRDREAALWTLIRTTIENAGWTYKAAQVRPLSVESFYGKDGWSLEVVWMDAGEVVAGPNDNANHWHRRTFHGANAAEIMAEFHEVFPVATYPLLMAAKDEATFWAEVKEIVRRAGLTYKVATIETGPPIGISAAHRLTVEVAEGHRSATVIGFHPGDARRMLARLRELMPQWPQVVNLRDYGAGGVKPRPWGPFDLPKDVLNVSRSGHNQYGSPFPFDGEDQRLQSLIDYRVYAIERNQREPEWIRGLDGYRLACWCRPPEGFNGRLLCHAQILVGLRDNRAPETVE